MRRRGDEMRDLGAPSSPPRLSAINRLDDGADRRIRRGDEETRRRGDKETRRQGDTRRGDEETRR
ncbi:hypothetical protein EYF80_051129 [Liparis tanakae]|uniref:Uncharacterized protein n=1 Tax=Liparis tanakae TaxID=230148 RepID=A0A4Z2FD66_9TELE|nr:hypothetical protein EYF80_051129 [Liparis tanakae]